MGELNVAFRPAAFPARFTSSENVEVATGACVRVFGSVMLLVGPVVVRTPPDAFQPCTYWPVAVIRSPDAFT